MNPSVLHVLNRTLHAGIFIILILIPFPFGAIQSQWLFALELGVCFLLALWAVIQIGSREVSLIRTRIEWPLLALTAYLCVTLLPIHPKLLKFISSETLRIYQSASQFISETGGPALPTLRLTLAPFDTEGEILKFVVYALFFFLVLNALRKQSEFITLYRVLIALGGIVAALGIARNLWINEKIYGKFYTETASLFGPFVNHNHFAGYIELSLGLAFGMLAAEIYKYRKQSADREGFASYFIWLSRKDGSRPWLLFVSAIVMLFALVSSLSRGGLLSFFTAAALFIFSWRLWRKDAPGKPGNSRHRRLAFLAILLVAVIITAVLASMPMQRQKWLKRSDSSVHYRLGILKDGAKAFTEFPLTGAGLGSYRSIIPEHRTGSLGIKSDHAENEYLQWAIETGAIGFILMAIVVCSLARRIWFRLARRKDSYFRCLSFGAIFSAISLSIHNAFDFNMHIPSNALTLAAILAICLLAANCHIGKHGERLMMQVYYYPIRSVQGVIVVSLAILASGFLGERAWTRYESQRLNAQWIKSRPFLIKSDPADKQTELLSKSIQSAAWNDESHYLKAAALETITSEISRLQPSEKHKILENAQNAALESIRLRPTEASYWIILGRIEQKRMSLALSDRAFQQAVKLAPKNGLIQLDYGLHLLWKGEARLAAARFILARNFSSVVDLKQMLEWISSATADRQIWQSLVKYDPPDLRVYASFLNNRGLAALGAQIAKEAEDLEIITNDDVRMKNSAAAPDIKRLTIDD